MSLPISGRLSASSIGLVVIFAFIMARSVFGSSKSTKPCPCLSGGSYEICCEPLHRGEQQAATAEQLMRSRYSAFAFAEVDYLIATHSASETPMARHRKELHESCHEMRWLKLKIMAVQAGGVDDLEGTVAFEATYQAGGQRSVMKELSLFQRRDRDCKGDWLYIKAL